MMSMPWLVDVIVLDVRDVLGGKTAVGDVDLGVGEGLAQA